MKKAVNRFVLATGIIAGSLVMGSSVNAALPFFSGDEVPSLAPMLQETTPAIVSISVEGTQVSRQRIPEMFRHFFGGPNEQVQERPFQRIGLRGHH